MDHRLSISALTAILAAAVSACGVGEATVTGNGLADTASALPVEISQPRLTDIYATYQTTSTLESDVDAPVLARVAGEVVEILAEEGQFVDEGQVLAKLDGQRLRFEMNQAQADYERIKSEYQRLVDMHQRGLVSAAMYDSLQFDMHAKKANFELKRLNHDYTTIRAPISGVISSREIKVGRQVYESDPLFRITDTSQLVAQLKIPQTELPKFEPGQSMQLHVDAMPELPYTATVARISPTIDVANGTFRATAYIDNSDGKLAPGMFARFRIAYDKHENALVIPGTAVIQEDNISTVYVVADGEANRRVIETGIESGDLIEVIGGLDASESVVTTGLAGLTDGSRVLASNAAAQGGSG